MIDFEALLREYKDGLFQRLRGFRAQQGGPAFLETWVPADDDLESIDALLDAATDAEAETLSLRFVDEALARIGRPALDRALARRATVTVVRERPALEVSLRLRRNIDAGPVAPAAAQPAERRPKRGNTPVTPSANATAAYDAALARVVIDHEGGLEERDGALLVRAERHGVTLAALVDRESRLIVAARHLGASDGQRAALDLACKRVEGAPIHDAADHGAIRLENELRGRGGPRAVPGIVSPDNADPRLRAVAELLRALGRAHRELVGPPPAAQTEWEPPPSPAWTALTDAARRERVRDTLAAAALALDIGPNDLVCERIEKTTRVVLSIRAALAPESKPDLLVRAERVLKERLDPALGVWLEEVSDKNIIRRLVKPEGAS